MGASAQSETNTKKGRSRISNGRALFPRTLDGQSIDMRGQWSRRVRDLVRSFTLDAGGDDAISEGMRSIIRRIALLQSQMERIEAIWALADGDASDNSLHSYMRMANAQRRLILSAGLKSRSMKTVPDLQSYIASKTDRRARTIDHDGDD